MHHSLCCHGLRSFFSGRGRPYRGKSFRLAGVRPSEPPGGAASSGGVLHAKATKKAACLPVMAGRWPGRGRSLNAGSNPLLTKRWRVRWTVETPRWSARAISSSVAPSAAWSNTWARATRRAAGLPLLIKLSRYPRSSSVRSTRY